MDPDLVSTMQQRIIASVSRSAVMILSTTLNKRLNPYFTASELILVLLSLHTFINNIRTVPGFNASWRTLRDLIQFMMVHSLAAYISISPTSSTGSEYTTILNLILALVTMDSLENLEELGSSETSESLKEGWVKDDLDSLTTSITYIFSDNISGALSKLNIQLFGASLALCLGGKGLLGKTLAFVGINTLSSLVFEAIVGGELSLAWPVTLLYFVHEVSAKYDVDSFFSFGLYRASDSIYSSLTGSRVINLSPATIFMTFLFLGSLFPSDPVWAGVCVLVFAQGGSDWFLTQLSFISATDPVLAGLSLVTAVHFVSVAVQSQFTKLESKKKLHQSG